MEGRSPRAGGRAIIRTTPDDADRHDTDTSVGGDPKALAPRCWTDSAEIRRPLGLHGAPFRLYHLLKVSVYSVGLCEKK
ncbi:hypothetical protein RRG08_034681 [Elysia crispata]|uniref:Uncharacterized protein n=1 Tax=Elysia crispata TaxID=231223 RepID=A0AAE0Z0U1_9GAST|nr:hypothetical protein RRG08_034681 [Elysia crispata]